MLVYTLDSYTFDRTAVIENYESCIWTERFADPGDFTLVVAETGEHSRKLRPGVILECDESEFVMLIENVELKDKKITVTGRVAETFFNELSLGPRAKTGTPREIMVSVVEDMQEQYDGALSLYHIDFATPSGEGVIADVTEKIKEREHVYDILLRWAKQYSIGQYMRRESIGSGRYNLVYRTWRPKDRSDGNPDGYATVRFSPDDENLVGVHELFTAVDDVDAVVVYPPSAFSKVGEFAEDMVPIIYTADGYVDSFNDMEQGAFDIRVKEADSDKLTAKYLTSQIPISYSGYVSSPFWTLLPDYQKLHILSEEMKRMAEALFKKSVRERKRVMDGEIATNSYRYGIDYDLGDTVEITTGLTDYYPGKRKAQVTEYIRSSDATGFRAYPTLAEPATPAPYANDPSQEADAESLDYEDHTFSINGLIPDTLETLSPHKVTVPSGSTVRIVSIDQTGPRDGECTLYFIRNSSYFDETDLPLNLSDGDDITVDPTDNDGEAAYVSGHFTIERSSS